MGWPTRSEFTLEAHTLCRAALKDFQAASLNGDNNETRNFLLLFYYSLSVLTTQHYRAELFALAETCENLANISQSVKR